MGMAGEMIPEPLPSTTQERLAFYDRFARNLAEREPDPVEALEREAHFETWKRKGAKK
jgi:hypothetical protein